MIGLGEPPVIGPGAAISNAVANAIGVRVPANVHSPGVPPPRPDVHRLPPHILIGVNAILALVALSALLSIWFGRVGAN